MPWIRVKRMLSLVSGKYPAPDAQIDSRQVGQSGLMQHACVIMQHSACQNCGALPASGAITATMPSTISSRGPGAGAGTSSCGSQVQVGYTPSAA